MKYFVQFVVFVFSIVIISCGDGSSVDNNSNQKELSDENTNPTGNNREIVILETHLEEFSKLLKEEDFTNICKFFSPSLRERPGDDLLIEGLQNRNVSMGVLEFSEIVYQYIDNNNNLDSLYYFHLRTTNIDNDVCYERIILQFIEKKPVIVSYEYSLLPYYSLVIANDKNSDLNMYLDSIYDMINSDDYDRIVELVDQELIDQVGEEKLKALFESQIAINPEVIGFKVIELESKIENGVVLVELMLDAMSENSSMNIDEITISVKGGVFSVVKYQRVESNVEKSNSELSNAEYGAMLKQSSLFYENLKYDMIDNIMNNIDESVFENNDYNIIKNSFLSRLNYYGQPETWKNTSHEIIKNDGILIVSFYYSVNNEKGIKSYEKIEIVKSNNGKYLLYGYDYSDTKFESK